MAKLRPLIAASLLVLSGCGDVLLGSVCVCGVADAGAIDAGAFALASDAAPYDGPLLQCAGAVLERYDVEGSKFVVSDVCVSEAACQRSVEADSASCVAP